MNLSIPDRIRVFTIAITAPQHAHRNDGRSLTQASARPGANFSTTCSKAISRLQLGCRNRSFALRRGKAEPKKYSWGTRPPETFGQHMLQDQPQEIRARQASAFDPLRLGEMMFVVWTPGDDEWPHIISARKAEKHEREAWSRFCK